MIIYETTASASVPDLIQILWLFYEVKHADEYNLLWGSYFMFCA